MADEIDATAERVELEEALLIGDVCRKAKEIQPGWEGDCYFCGEHFKRVVEVVDPATDEVVTSCGRCRDRRGIE